MSVKRKKRSNTHEPQSPRSIPSAPGQAGHPRGGCAKSKDEALLSDTNMEALVPEGDSFLQRNPNTIADQGLRSRKLSTWRQTWL